MKGAIAGDGHTKNGCDGYVRAKGHISTAIRNGQTGFIIKGRIKYRNGWMRRPMCERWGILSGTTAGKLVSHRWAHQTLLDGCDCLFAMEKPRRARGEYYGDNGRSFTTKI